MNIKFNKVGVWYILLTKRFFKKPLYLLALCTIPLLILCLRLISSNEKNILNIAVYVENDNDELSHELSSKLFSNKGIINYFKVNTSDQLNQSVLNKDADCGYIIPDNLHEHIIQYASGINKDLPFNGHIFSVITQKDTVQLQLAREQFYGIFYRYLSPEITNEFISSNQEFGYIDKVQLIEQLDNLYSTERVTGSLFAYTYSNGETNCEENDYLVSPVRGLLSVFLLLIGLSSAMFFVNDTDHHIFDWISIKHFPVFSYFYLFTAMIPGGIAAYTGLYISGRFTIWFRELPLMFLYILAVTGLVNLVQRYFHRVIYIGTMIPFLIIISLALCPVFINIKGFMPVKLLLPAYPYLTALFNNRMYVILGIYAATAFIAGLIPFRRP